LIFMDVSVERYSLTICARDTVNSLLDCADHGRGARLDDALSSACEYRGTAAYAVTPFMRVERDHFRPDAEDVWPSVGGRDEADVLHNLAKAGVVELDTVWRDTDGDSYLDEGRIITAVRVLRPFAVVQVAYRWDPGSIRYYADHWEITGRTRVVGMGTYVVGEIGDFRMSYVGAASIDSARVNERGTDLDTLTCWAVEQQDFDASHCEAGCDDCGARWSAECGSWHFRPHDFDGPAEVAAFDYDDAEDHDMNDTIACPHCHTGRAGFMVF
jgi:hypothetical protein